MNERIRELASAAGFDIEEGGHIMLHHVYLTNRMEQFAQLIIRDCYSVIIKSQRGHFNPATSWDAVKEHFGVKE